MARAVRKDLSMNSDFFLRLHGTCSFSQFEGLRRQPHNERLQKRNIPKRIRSMHYKQHGAIHLIYHR